MTMFAGQDLNQYGKWEKLVAPGGQVYYKIPGSGYIYDPTLSQASGKAVIYTDPTHKLNERDKAQKAAKDAASPLNQALPLVGSVGGTLAAAHAMNALGPTTAADKLIAAQTEATLAKTAALQGAGLGGAAPAIPGLGGGAPLVNGAVAPEATFGGTMAAAAPYLGVAGAGLGAYGIHNAIESNNVGAGALSGAGLGLGLGAAAPLLLGAGPLGWGALGLMALGGAGFGGGLTAALGSPTTKEIQAGRWKDAGRADLAGNANRDYFAGTGGEENRNEDFLTADAIRVNPDNYNAAKDFDSWSKPAQDEFLNGMLDAKNVREKKGGIYFNDDNFAKSEADRIREKYKADNMGKQLADKKNARSR